MSTIPLLNIRGETKQLLTTLTPARNSLQVRRPSSCSIPSRRRPIRDCIEPAARDEIEQGTNPAKNSERPVLLTKGQQFVGNRDFEATLEHAVIRLPSKWQGKTWMSCVSWQALAVVDGTVLHQGVLRSWLKSWEQSSQSRSIRSLRSLNCHNLELKLWERVAV